MCHVDVFVHTFYTDKLISIRHCKASDEPLEKINAKDLVRFMNGVAHKNQRLSRVQSSLRSPVNVAIPKFFPTEVVSIRVEEMLRSKAALHASC